MPFDSIMSSPIETERKFLIRMPDISMLKKLEGARILNIEQTYLLSKEGENSRVRKIEENGCIKFIKTTKKRISTLSCYEYEEEISIAQYDAEIKNADTSKNTIIKTRYTFPFNNHTLEIDVYPFWNDRSILEIELTDEGESFKIPSFIEVIREVSEDSRYKNTNLALSIPFDII